MTTPGLPDVPSSVFERRRDAVLAALGHGILVLAAAPVQVSSRDNERPYQPDRELYYLTGASEPETVAVLVGGQEQRLVLFVRERDPDAELWAGSRLGPEEAGERFGATESYGVSELGDRLPALLGSGDRIHFRLGRGGSVQDQVIAALVHARARGARSGSGPRGITDPGEIFDDLRLIKDDVEIDRLRRAAEISVEGHLAGAGAVGPGTGEWVVEAAVEGAFRAAGAKGPGFETIVGAGVNACVLHYVDNSATIGEGDLVLVDAGAEYGLYHGDITRTYPASGRFSGRQKEVYDLVEAGRGAGVSAVMPGATMAEVHAAVVRVLVDGLIGLGVLEGAVDDLIEAGAHKSFFPHQTSHWLGLDVHDPGDYAKDGVSRTLRPGMVFTVEPGLYFGSDQATAFSGIGVRIEDDILVTEKGCEVLTAALPTARSEVEALVGSDS